MYFFGSKDPSNTVTSGLAPCFAVPHWDSALWTSIVRVVEESAGHVVARTDVWVDFSILSSNNWAMRNSICAFDSS